MQDRSRPTEPRRDLVDLAAGLVPALAGRAAGYDEADAFCHEDFDDLTPLPPLLTPKQRAEKRKKRKSQRQAKKRNRKR